jgi:hypothetical protein
LVMPMLNCRFMGISSVAWGPERDHNMAVCRTMHG